MAFLGGDTNYVYNGVGSPFNSGVTMACNAMPFFVWANQPSTLNNPNNDIYTPCIKTNYDKFWTETELYGTESFYEAGVYLGCVGPSTGCSFPIGTYSTALTSGVDVWDLYFSYLDETKSHDLVFTKPTGVAWNTHTITVQDCWSNATLPSVVATPTQWTSTMTSWTVNVPANTPIGNATFTLNPNVPAAITDLNFGYVYVRPNLLPAGTYTLAYNFQGSECPGPGANGQFVFTITNPYNANWTPPSNLCNTGSCVALTTSGTAGGTWSGTGVSGSQFCPGTSGAGSFAVTYSVGISATCRATQTNSVTVTATPTLSVAGGTICANQSIVLSNTGTSASSYTWSPGGGNASTATVSPSGTTTYTLTGANANCSSSTTALVNVTPNPTISIASSAAANICSGNSTTLTASGATTYTWSANAGGGNSGSVVVSPGSTETYTVTGTTSGCSSAQVITVNVTPTPTISTSASAATICAGQSTTLTASGATTYTWLPGGSTSNPLVASPGSSTTYTVTGSTSGCNSTQVVSVNVNPLPTIGISAQPSGICTGQSTTLTASGASTYTWSANAGGGSTNPVSVSPSSTDTYTISGTDANGCTNQSVLTVSVSSSAPVAISATSNTICSGQSLVLSGSGATNYTWMPGGQTGSTLTVTPSSNTTYTLNGDNGTCTGSNTLSIGVVPNPTVNATTSSAALCSGSSVTLTGSGATNYTWMPGGSTASSFTDTPSATTTYTLTGESGGCTASAAITVSVTPTPTVSASASSGTVCAGQSVVLSGGGASTFTWMPGGSSATTITVSPSGSTTYTLTGANGTCTATATAAVNVTPLPVITANAASSAICSGQSTLLTAGGATTYTWSANAGGVNTTTVSVNPATTTVYTVSGTNNGCDNATQVTVTVNPTPTVAVSASSGTICAGQGTTLSAAGATNYTWSPGGSTSSGVSVSPATNTTYTVTGEAAGCTATSTVEVVVNPTPTLGGTPVLDSALCGMSTGAVTGINVTGGTPAYTYQWYNGSTPITGATGDSLTNLAAGTYSVVVTDANSCVATGGTSVFTIPGTGAVTAAITPAITQGQAPLNVTFTNGSSGASSYVWNFGNGSNSVAQNPSTAVYMNAGTYTVTMLAANGSCLDTAMAIVIVDDATSLIIPNIFSPNGDGTNDEFYVFNTGLNTLTCEIYNRWGQKMYTLNSPQERWDGRGLNGERASEGTYYYILKAVGTDGVTHEQEGYVTLVR